MAISFLHVEQEKDELKCAYVKLSNRNLTATIIDERPENKRV